MLYRDWPTALCTKFVGGLMGWSGIQVLRLPDKEIERRCVDLRELEQPLVAVLLWHPGWTVVPQRLPDERRVRSSLLENLGRINRRALRKRCRRLAHILFIVYDPDRRISNDRRFACDFKRRGRCSILIVR